VNKREIEMADIVNTLKDANWELYAVDKSCAYFKHKKTQADIYIRYPKWIKPFINMQVSQAKNDLQIGLRKLLGIELEEGK
jgi:hypothetical protein